MRRPVDRLQRVPGLSLCRVYPETRRRQSHRKKAGREPAGHGPGCRGLAHRHRIHLYRGAVDAKIVSSARLCPQCDGRPRPDGREPSYMPSMSALANPLVETSVAPSVWRAKS